MAAAVHRSSVVSRRPSHRARRVAALILVGLGLEGARGGDIPAGSAAVAESGEAVSGGVSRQHPKAPPPPLQADTPPNSTVLTLKLEQGEWAVMIENDISESEMRILMNDICEKAEEPGRMTGAVIAAKWAAVQHGYDRTEWWFEKAGAMDVFDTYLAGLVASAPERPVRVLEVGSFEGASAMWFAKNLLLHPDSALYCLDTWTGGQDFLELDIEMTAVEDRFRRNIGMTVNNERVTAVKGDSMISLAGLVSGGAASSFDAIYVDGSHTMTNALSDALLSFRLLKVGGFLIFDDIESFPDVGLATNAFVEAVGGKDGRLDVLHRQELLVLQKTAEDPWATPTSVITMMGS